MTLSPTDLYPRQSSEPHADTAKHYDRLRRQLEREQGYAGIDGDVRAIRHGAICGLAAIVLLVAILYGPELAAWVLS